MRDARRIMTGRGWPRSLAQDTSGAVAIYIALVAPILLGIGALTLDIGRLITLNTELQAAGDAAALAGARELDRFPGSMDRAGAAAVGAVSNLQTFATDGGGKKIVVDSTTCADPPVAPCIRFLKSLPAGDGDPITAANVTTVDDEARFIDVHIGARTITNILIRIVGGPGTAATSSTAVAGNDRVICNIPPMFMCNPTEPATNTDLGLTMDMNALSGRQVELFRQGGGGSLTPGNFGLLCPSGTEGQTNCGASTVKEALASTTGTCIGMELATTQTGVDLGMVRTGINVRFDYWTPQAKDTGNNRWRNQDKYMPAANVTQGGEPPNNTTGGNATCQYSDLPATEATKLPRDQCHIAGNCGSVPGNINGNDRIGDGTWDYLEYFRINHGCNQNTSPTCKPAGWDAVTAAAPWPPSRYETYRYEIEQSPDEIVATGQDIYNADGTDSGFDTTENGQVECFQGTPPTIPGYNYFPAMAKDLTLLGDRRIMPIIITNCNALNANGISTNGKFSFAVTEVGFVFLTEPMEQAPAAEIYAEIVGTLDDGAQDLIVRDIIQLYRR